MADTIKGLSVKIGADTSDFIKELKKVDKEINQTSKTANELQKGLKLEFDEQRFVQAQKQVQKALETTEQKADAIRKQMKQLEDAGQVDSENYRKLEAELAKTENTAVKLKNQLQEIEKVKIENATKKFTDLSNKLETAAQKTAIFSAAAVGAIVGINKLGKDAVATGDQIQTTADQYNLSAEAIQKWNYIAMQSDVPADQLYKSMTKARDAIGTALVGGTSTARTALESLIGDLTRVPTDTEGAFNTVIMALAGVEDSTLQAYYANEIFGERVATQLIPLLKQGAGGLAELGREFESVGYLSNEQVRELAEFDNELNKVNQQIENAKTELGLALLPILQNFSDLLINVVIPAIKGLADWFGSLPEPAQDVITALLLIVAALSPVLFIISKIIAIIPSLIKMFQWLKTAAGTTTLGIMSMVAALGLVFDLIGNWSQMSALEKVLKSLALAFLIAAAAVTVFHASWSLGLAIGAITAAVVAGVAAINAAGESIGVDTNFSDTSSIESAANSSYEIPKSTGTSGNTYNEDNSTYNIEVNLNASGNLEYDSNALAEEVIKKIIIAKQSSGR